MEASDLQISWRKYTKGSINETQIYSENVLSASANGKDINKGWW